MFEKILVAVDGSPLSERILGSLEPLLVRPGAELLLVRVVGSRQTPAHAGALQELRSLERRFTAKGFVAGGHLLAGEDPAAEIVSFAAKTGASLIAVGTHGRTGISRLALGSVAERIVRTADRPVLLVNALTPSAPLQLKRVVVPIDGSERSEEALPVAAELARRFGAELILVTVEDREVLSSPVMVAEAQRKAVRALERARNALPGARIQNVVRVGFPGEEVVTAIAEARPDAVLMTTHGRTGLARVAFGSVAEEVIRRSPVPVIVLRSVPELAEKRHAAAETRR